MSSEKSHLRSKLRTVRGLGSAKDGTHHWWMQRITAIVMIPLSLWFVYSMLTGMMGSDVYEVAVWFGSPINTVATLILLTAMFWHAKLGIQVVIEDYVHCACMKTGMLIGSQILFATLAVVSWVAVIKMHVVGF